MGYEVLGNIWGFITGYYELLATASIFLSGWYTYSRLYEKTRPVVEGEVINVNFTNKDNSRVKVRTEKHGDLDLIIDTKRFNLGPLINIGGGVDYKGRADELSALLSVGSRVRAKVEGRNGLERRVCELSNIYLGPSHEKKVMFVGDFLGRLINDISDLFFR